jgi:hypothetical protein
MKRKNVVLRDSLLRSNLFYFLESDKIQVHRVVEA